MRALHDGLVEVGPAVGCNDQSLGVLLDHYELEVLADDLATVLAAKIPLRGIESKYE